MVIERRGVQYQLLCGAVAQATGSSAAEALIETLESGQLRAGNGPGTGRAWQYAVQAGAAR